MNDKLDPVLFDHLKNVITRNKLDKKIRRSILNSNSKAIYPYELTIQLTSNCNLRCKHCFQWSKLGFHTSNTSNSLDFEVLKSVLSRNNMPQLDLYFWGGEPLVYYKWDELVQFLKEINTGANITISTNGILLLEKVLDLVPISKWVTIIVSLDGLEEDHDKLRGKGTFKKIENSLNYILTLKKLNLFKGLIVLNATLNDSLIGNLYEFVSYCDKLKVDRLVLGFPWFISEQFIFEMDEYYESNLSKILGKKKSVPSWRSYGFCLDHLSIEKVKQEVEKVSDTPFSIKVDFHPNIRYNDIESIIKCKKTIFNRNQNCTALTSRAAIFADGSVGFCANFPEFVTGHLKDNSLFEIWNSDQMNQLRKVRIMQPMSPMICQRCRLLSNNPQ